MRIRLRVRHQEPINPLNFDTSKVPNFEHAIALLNSGQLAIRDSGILCTQRVICQSVDRYAAKPERVPMAPEIGC